MPHSRSDNPDPEPTPTLPEAGDGASYPCRRLVEQITEYLDDALDEHERAVLEEHLQLCDGCRNYVEHVRVVIRASGRLADRSRLDEVDSGVMEIFREWSRTKRPE